MLSATTWDLNDQIYHDVNYVASLSVLLMLHGTNTVEETC